MSDLREQLAEKFFVVGCDADPHPNAGSLEFSSEVRLAVADECLRQMEWAYRRGSEPGVLAASFDEYDYNTLPTLAPEDWKP